MKKFWDCERWCDCDEDGSEASGESCAGRVEVDAVMEDDAEDVDEGPATETSLASVDESELTSLVEDPPAAVFSVAVSFVSSCCACAT